MAKRSYWPAPVYVATFDDGTVGRMSFWSQEGKPVDVARGRRLVSQAFASDPILSKPREVGWARARPYLEGWRLNVRKLVSGHVEFNGETIPDDMREPVVVKVKKRPAKPVALQALAALDRGDIHAAREALRLLAA